jgi:hypothetical protein
MAEITAALFATQERTHGDEHRLIAYAFLYEGARPYWEVHIGGKLFRFIPNPDFLLEDGLSQLNMYCQIPENEYKHDVSDNAPLTLEEELGEDEFKKLREELVKDLLENNHHFKLVQWPGFWLNKWNDKIKIMQDAGVNITAQI